MQGCGTLQWFYVCVSCTVARLLSSGVSRELAVPYQLDIHLPETLIREMCYSHNDYFAIYDDKDS